MGRPVAPLLVFQESHDPVGPMWGPRAWVVREGFESDANPAEIYDCCALTRGPAFTQTSEALAESLLGLTRSFGE